MQRYNYYLVWQIIIFVFVIIGKKKAPPQREREHPIQIVEMLQKRKSEHRKLDVHFSTPGGTLRRMPCCSLLVDIVYFKSF
jgi:hypothetical protein